MKKVIEKSKDELVRKYDCVKFETERLNNYKDHLLKELALLGGKDSVIFSSFQKEVTFDFKDPYDLNGKTFEKMNPRAMTAKFFGARKSSEEVKRPLTSNDHGFVKKRGTSVELPYAEPKSNRRSIGTRSSSQQSQTQIEL